ncbi:MAG: hypothetical protein H6811_02330 [Phycisphaeraceae bacterium]|nr:hypothetical protein [Phycisphaeraceae bacterium]
MIRAALVVLASGLALTACKKEEPKTTQEKVKDAVKQGKEKAKEAAASVSQAAKDAFQKYMGDLGQLKDKLSNVDGLTSAVAAAPQVKPIVDSIKGYLGQYRQEPPETRSALNEMFGDEIGPIVEELKGEIRRLVEGGQLGQLGDMIRNMEFVGG